LQLIKNIKNSPGRNLGLSNSARVYEAQSQKNNLILLVYKNAKVNLDFSRFMEECGKIGFLKFLKKIGVCELPNFTVG
jgi:hypothetical protein